METRTTGQVEHVWSPSSSVRLCTGLFHGRLHISPVASAGISHYLAFVVFSEILAAATKTICALIVFEQWVLECQASQRLLFIYKHWCGFI